MNWLVPVALYGWIPFVAALFALLRPARAVLVAYLAGWMFLPIARLELFGFFDFTKATAIPLVVFLAALFFDSASLRRLRFTPLDLPIAAFCVAPLVSSIGNDLGAHDALSALVYQTVTWGLPYLTGRMYFSSRAGLEDLGLGLVAGGLVYLPLCLWEIRMSPQLHATVYGFHQHDWTQTIRLGGYRPMVFMQHGLMVGLWMAAATLAAVALWKGTRVRKLWGLPLPAIVLALLGTTVLCKSFGAVALLLLALLLLWGMRALRTSLPMAVVACVPATYVLARTVGEWSGEGLTSLVAEVSEPRSESLAYRLAAEEKLRVKAAERPLVGWGGWGRSFVRRFEDRQRKENVVTDSQWILVFGKNGALGLAALLLLFLAPVVALWRRCPPKLWRSPGAALPWALGTVVTLYALDSLVNAMENPVYVLIAGGLCGLAPAAARVRRAAPVPLPSRRRRAAVPVP